MQIEVDMFSGRVNPMWYATPPEAAEIRALLAELPASSMAAAARDGLGFRGFIITDEQTKLQSVVCFDQVLQLSDAGLAGFCDGPRKLDRALLTQARLRLNPELLEMVQQDLGLDETDTKP